MFSFLSLLIPGNLLAQSGSISGTVTDSRTGEVLPGVNVRVLELTKGGATNIDGVYEITALPAGSYTVVATFTGFKEFRTTTQISSSNVVLDILLEEDILGLEELVVTGYTELSRNKITGSITTVSNKNIESIPVASLEQLVQGRTPGVFITTGSGQPGTGSTVRVRGSGSITGGNAPLYVLDGIVINGNDFATLNTNDVESISILKDASATAQYGARGANGVFVINTKRGKAGRTLMSYNGQYGVSIAGPRPFNMMNTAEKLQFEEIIRTGSGWATSPNNPANAGANATAAAEARATLLSRDTDWTDVFFRDGITQSHDLNVSGGNENARYLISGSIFNQEGIGIRSELNRQTIRVNTDITANEYFEFGVNGSVGYSESDFPPGAGVNLANPFASAYLANPYETLFDDEGNIASGRGQTGANSYDRLINDVSFRTETKVVGQSFARFKIDNFILGQSFSVDYRDRDFTGWNNPNSYAGGLVTRGNSGSLGKSFGRSTGFISTTSLRYRNVFQDRHQLNLFAANEFTKDHGLSYGFTGYGLNPKLGPTPSAITPGSPTNNLIPPVNGGISQATLWSVFGIADYSLDDKYNLKLTLRRDGSSRFGVNNQYAILWSVGTSWVASSEDFLRDNDIVSNLIIRASYGKAGNQAGIGSYQRLATFAATSFAGEPTIVPAAPGNENLKWEISNKANLGFDFGLFDNRVSGTLEFYNDVTEDLFISQSLSRTSGFGALSINAGSMRNRGIELGLSGDILRTRNSLLTLNANYSNNQNEILDLGQVDEFEAGTSIIRKGLSLGTHYVVEWAGVDPATGAPLYVDLDGNVTPNFSDGFAKADFGSWLPTVTGGFGLDYAYKNFSVRAQFNYSYGNKIFNNQLFFQENHGFAGFNMRRTMLDIWQNPGDITEIQSNQFARQFSSKDIEDASYIKFRNLMVSYNIPGSVFNNQIKNIRVFVQGQNLFTWTAFTGFDPENGNNIAQYGYPLPRIFTTGLNINF